MNSTDRADDLINSDEDDGDSDLVAELYELDDPDDMEINVAAYGNSSPSVGSNKGKHKTANATTSIAGNDAHGLRETYHAMIYTYSRAGKIDRARWLFEEMLEYNDELLRPATKTYDVMLHCLASHGYVDDAKRLFESLLWSPSALGMEDGQDTQGKDATTRDGRPVRRYRPAHVDGRLYSSMVSILVRHGDVDGARYLVEELTARGYNASPRVAASLISGMGKLSSQIRAADNLVGRKQQVESLDEMFEIVCADLVAMFRNCSPGQHRQHQHQHKQHLQHNEQAVDTYNSVLSTLAADSSTLQYALKLKARMEQEGVSASISAYADLICELCRLCVVGGWVIEYTREHKGASEDTGIMTLRALPEHPFSTAEALFDEVARSGMLGAGGKHGQTFNWMVQARAISGQLQSALSLFEELEYRGLQREAHTYAILISTLAKEGRIDDAWALFRSMETDRQRQQQEQKQQLPKHQQQATSITLQPDRTRVYAEMVHGLVTHGHFKEAQDVFAEMRVNGLARPARMHAVMVRELAKQGRLRESLAALKQMQSEGHDLTDHRDIFFVARKLAQSATALRLQLTQQEVLWKRRQQQKRAASVARKGTAAHQEAKEMIQESIRMAKAAKQQGYALPASLKTAFCASKKAFAAVVL